MEKIVVKTIKDERIVYTIAPASINELLGDIALQSANMAAGLILSGIIYDDQECLELAEVIMERIQDDLWVMAEDYMAQCLDTDWPIFSDCGEVNCTKLAEETAKHLDHDEWLDDCTHWIWDLALEVADEYDER